MKKKFYGALLVGSLFLAGGMVSCSDYDDDINSLNERVDALEKTVAELQKAIEAGAVITNVESTENGVKVTLSDGKTFEVKNGANGADGKPGSVVTIDKEGYWCIDGIRQTDENGNPYKAQGEKGEAGEPGKPGEDGKDGCWYVPAKDGYWHKQYYNEEGTVVDEATDQKWTPSEEESVRVVYDPVNGCLEISNAEGMEKDQTLYIPITSNLKSLAAIPYILDEDTKYPLVFFYNIMGYTGDFEVGNGTVDLSVATSTDAKAHYRLNPANANTQDWSWTMIDRTVTTVSSPQATRATGDKNELLSIKSTLRDNDEFIVTLKSNESLENLVSNNMFKEHAIAALQGTNKETAEVITSDYIKVSCKDLTKFTIITGYDDIENIFALPKAGEEVNPDYINHAPDVNLLYTESLDLNTIVKTWAEEVQPTSIPTLVDDMVDKGELTYEFTLPASYKLGGNKTNQQDFVTLDGSVLKVNTEKWPNGTAAIGTTPIVWVRAIINNKTIATGVMKVAVVKEEAVEKPAYVVAADPVNIDYSDITTKAVNQFTWEDMRQIYDALKMTREEFLEHYQTITITDEKDNSASIDVNDNSIVYLGGIGLANYTDDDSSTEQTNAIEMFMNPTKVASNANGTIKITYTPDDKYSYAPVVVEFAYTISHTHQVDFTKYFNPQHVEVVDGVGVAKIKGIMENNGWKQVAEVQEHFINLDEYVENMPGNHNSPRLIINTKDPRVTDGVKLRGNDLYDQTIELTIPVIGKEFIVPVTIVEPLSNGEMICGQNYEIHFINPFSITTTISDLEAAFPGRSDSEAITITIKDIESNTEIATIKGDADGKYMDFSVKGKAAEYGLSVNSGDDTEIIVSQNNASDEYELVGGVKSGNITVLLTEADSQSWAKLYGMNNDNTQRLTLDDETGMIKWENRGTSLVNDLTPSYNVQVRLGNISILSTTKQFKVKETNLPTE